VRLRARLWPASLHLGWDRFRRLGTHRGGRRRADTARNRPREH
jgi:hypothetical protein